MQVYLKQTLFSRWRVSIAGENGESDWWVGTFSRQEYAERYIRNCLGEIKITERHPSGSYSGALKISTR
jgi:hypothetical protein